MRAYEPGDRDARGEAHRPVGGCGSSNLEVDSPADPAGGGAWGGGSGRGGSSVGGAAAREMKIKDLQHVTPAPSVAVQARHGRGSRRGCATGSWAECEFLATQPDWEATALVLARVKDDYLHGQLGLRLSLYTSGSTSSS